MKMVGTQNAHDLVTVSTDGKMCTWSVDNLNAPIDTVTLCCKTKRQVNSKKTFTCA
jgi:dynein intermediate chain, cytosolic